MQQLDLFDDSADLLYDPNHDPYEEVRAESCRLAAEYDISDEEAFDLVLCFGSAEGALRALRQRWWSGEVELREADAA